MTHPEAVVRRSAQMRSQQAELLAWIKAELRMKPERKVRGVLLLEAAEILERAGKVGDGAKTLVTAANVDPRLLPAVWALIHLFLRRGSWKNIGRLREAEAKAATNTAERAAALVARGEVLEDHLGQPEAASEAYEAALGEEPDNRLALLSIYRHAAVNGNLERLAQALEHLAEQSTDPRRKACWLVDRGELEESLPGGTVARASELFREAAGIEDGQWHWLGALERHATRHDFPAELADALRGRARLMAALASLETASEAARFGVPRVREPAEAASVASALYRRAARIRHRRLDDPSGALADLRAAHELSPDDPLVADDLVRLLEGAGRLDEACATLEPRLARAPDSGEASVIRLHLAELFARRGDTDAAVAQLRAVLEQEPSSPVVLAVAEELLLGAGCFADLAAAYEKLASAFLDEAPALAASLIVRAAETRDLHLGDPEGALALLGRLPEAGVDALLGRHLEVAILARLERWKDLAAALDDLADRVEDGATAAAFLVELFAVQLGRSNDPVLALATLARLIDRVPGALWALELAAELHAGLEQWAELATTYRRIAAATDSDEHAAACLAVAGWLYHVRCDQPGEAAACYRASLERRPEGAIAAVGLEDLLRQGADDRGLRALLRDRADTATSEDEAQRALLELALDHERGAEHEEAAAVYQEVVDRFGDSRLARWGLMRCFRGAGRWEDLADAIDIEADLLEAPRDRSGLLLELAEVATDRLGRPAMAEDALRRARDIAPDLLPANLMLADSARASGSWHDVDLLLQELLTLAPEAALLVAEERLALLAGPLGQSEEADAVCQVMLDNMPDHRGALLTRALLSASSGRAEPRVESLLALSKLEPRPSASFALGAHAALAARVAGLPPVDPLALPEGDDTSSPAYAVAAFDSAPGSEVSKARLLEARLAATKDPRCRAYLEADLAGAYAVAGDVGAALEAYGRVLEAMPHSIVALEGLRDAAERLELWEVRAETTERLAELHPEPGGASSLWASAARTWEEAVGDLERTEIACRRALAFEPGRPDAFVRLVRLLDARKDRAGQLEIVAERASGVDDARELADLLMLQSAIQVELDDLDGALATLDRALEAQPDSAAALRARSLLSIRAQRWEDAAAALAEEARHLDGSDRREALWRAAEVLDAELGAPERAVEVLRPLVEERDPEPETYRRLLSLASRARSWPDAAAALSVLAAGAGDDLGREVALRAEGRVRAELGDDPAGARRVFQALVELRPDDLEAIETLASLTDGEERDALLQALAEGVRRALDDDPTSAPGLRTLARVHRLRGRPDGVVAILLVLDGLGMAEREELDELRDLLANAAREPQRPLTAESIERLLRHPAQRGPAEELHAVLAPILPKVFAADLPAMSLGKPLRPRGGDLLHERLSAAAEVFGLESIAVRPDGGDPFGLFAVPVPEPTLAVGSQVTGQLGPSLRFLLGRAVWHAAKGTAALASRTDDQIRALQDAATKEGERSFEPVERRLGVDALQKEVHRHLPRRARRPLAEAAQQVARAPEEVMVGWCRAVRLSADRAGLLFAGEVSAALATVVPGWQGADPAERAASAERVGGSFAARELLRFAISEGFLLLRAELGVAAQGWRKVPA